MSDNWVVQNLENALETWNEKLSEIWTLITTTPQNFKGGNIWKVIVDINGAVQAIGLALLVLFFVIGMVKTCGTDDFARRNGNDHRGLRIFREYSLVGGNAYRRIIYHGAVVHSDNDSVWTIFQVVYVHSTCTDTAFHICRRTDTECRQEFYQELLCSSA